jgi:hypothetical protein
MLTYTTPASLNGFEIFFGSVLLEGVFNDIEIALIHATAR